MAFVQPGPVQGCLSGHEADWKLSKAGISFLPVLALFPSAALIYELVSFFSVILPLPESPSFLPPQSASNNRKGLADWHPLWIS